MSETKLQKGTTLFEKVVLVAFYLFIAFIIAANALALLDGKILQKVLGTLILIGLVLFTGVLLNIKPLKIASHYFIKMLTPIVKPILKVTYEIINALLESTIKVFCTIPFLLGMLVLLVVSVVIFAIVKWAFNYVF